MREYIQIFCELWKEDPQFRARCNLAHLSLFLSVVVLVVVLLVLHYMNKNGVGGEEELSVCITLMLVGLSVFAIGVVKSVKSKCTDLTAVTWLWSGVALINIATVLAGAL